MTAAYWQEPTTDASVDQSLRLDTMLDQATARYPDREAIAYLPESDAPVRMTYVQLADAVEHTARALLASGIRRGGVIAHYASNRLEFVLLQLACARLGATMVPVDPTYRAREIEDLLGRAEVEICFTASHDQRRDLARELSSIAGSLPKLRTIVHLDTGWQGWLDGSASVNADEYESARARAQAGDVVQIQFTSGTTGRPKGVRISNAAFANMGRLLALRAGIEPGCRFIHTMPFFHVAGTNVIALNLAQAGTHVFQPRFSPDAMAAAVDVEQATVILAVPSMLISLASSAEASELDFANLRTVLTGAAQLSERTARHWIDTYGVAVSNTYGMTEITGPALQTAATDSLERTLTTVGRPLPGIEVEVVAVGTSRRLSIGEEGEVRFRGWGLMESYHGDAEATTAAVSADGWLRSGDLGVLDGDGYLRISGRAKDLIIRGGQNISPSAVEEAIRAVAHEVVDVSVVGAPDDYYGEIVCAFVILRPGTSLSVEDLARRLEDHVAHHMIPARVIAVDTFPMTPSGKVQKYRLRGQPSSQV